MGSAVLSRANRLSSGHFQSLLHMELSGLAVFTDTAVVIHTVSHVGVLLDLRDEDIFSNSMNCAGLDEENVTLLYFHRVQNLEKRVVFDTLCELFLADLTVEAVVKVSAFLAVYHIPHLGFSVLMLVFQRIGIVRMHLNGQVILRIDKFDQHRKLVKTAAVGSKHLSACQIYVFLQGLSCILSICHKRRTVRMTGYFPALCQNVTVVGLMIFLDQSSSAPDIILKTGGQL